MAISAIIGSRRDMLNINVEFCTNIVAGVNPMITTEAIAFMVAEGIAQNRKEYTKQSQT